MTRKRYFFSLDNYVLYDQTFSSRQAENSLHELIIADLNPPIAVRIEFLECLAELLDNDTCTYEAVEGNTGDSGTGNMRGCGVFLLDEVNHLRGEIETELLESLLKFLAVDGTRSITIKVPEDILPILNVLPEAGKLVEGDCSTAIGVKDCHKQLDSI